VQIGITVPYPEGYDERAVSDLKAQGQKIADELAEKGKTVSPTSQVVAMIAYLHKLGKDITPELTSEEKAEKEASKELIAEFEALESAADLEAGKALYDNNCVACHAADGAGGVGESLIDDKWIYGNTPAKIYDVINNGVGAMPGYKTQMNELEKKQVTSYILKGLKK